MPLHTECEAGRVRDADRLNGAVLGHPLDHDTFSRLKDALAVQRIDLDLLATEDHCERAARHQADLVAVGKDAIESGMAAGGYLAARRGRPEGKNLAALCSAPFSGASAPPMIRLLVLLLTLLTGFSGLVYEVTWQSYLATLLGSHSEATAAVLGLFLGGLSLGYSLFGARTRRLVARAPERGRPAPLLPVYGVVEAAIGLFALVFPWLFARRAGPLVPVPHGSAGLGFAFDVVLSALLVCRRRC